MKQLLFFIASMLAALASGAQAQSFGYTDYSFKQQMNLGSGITGKATAPSAWLEIGPATSTSTRGILMPRGDRNQVQNPVIGLIFYDVNDRKVYQYNGFTWEMVGGTEYTNEMARDAIGAALVNSGSITWQPDDVANTITAAVDPAFIKNIFSIAPGSVGLTYNAATGQFSSTGGITAITLNTSGVLYQTPINFSLSGTTATGSLQLQAQAANMIFAGPPTGPAATPTFRALVGADLPGGSNAYIANGTTQQTASFNINGTGKFGNLVYLGVMSIDAATGSANGAIYYNSTSNKFRGYINGAWQNMIGGGDAILNQTSVQTNSNFSIDGTGRITMADGGTGLLLTTAQNPPRNTTGISISYTGDNTTGNTMLKLNNSNPAGLSPNVTNNNIWSRAGYGLISPSYFIHKSNGTIWMGADTTQGIASSRMAAFTTIRHPNTGTYVLTNNSNQPATALRVINNAQSVDSNNNTNRSNLAVRAGHFEAVPSGVSYHSGVAVYAKAARSSGNNWAFYADSGKVFIREILQAIRKVDTIVVVENGELKFRTTAQLASDLGTTGTGGSTYTDAMARAAITGTGTGGSYNQSTGVITFNAQSLYTSDGTLTGTRTINGGGFGLSFKGLLSYYVETSAANNTGLFLNSGTIAMDLVNSGNYRLGIYGNDSRMAMISIDNSTGSKGTFATPTQAALGLGDVNGDFTNGIKVDAAGNLIVTNAQVYADNAAASALPVGTIYRNATGDLKIRY